MDRKQRIEKKKKRRRVIFNILLFLLAVMSSAYIIIYTEVFNVKEIQVYGNKQMTETEIIELSGLNIGDNLLRIEKRISENRVATGVMIKEAEIKRKLPDIIQIHVIERQEAVFMMDPTQAIILDYEGIPLKYSEADANNLPMIRLDRELTFRLGEMVSIDNSDIKVLTLIELLYYIKINGFDYVGHIDIRNNQVFVTTSYGTLIKLDYRSNMKYQILFTKEIINDRMKNNQDILGLIDFTRGENPVYIDFDDMEVKLEE